VDFGIGGFSVQTGLGDRHGALLTGDPIPQPPLLPERLQNLMEDTTALTHHNQQVRFSVAVNYGGRQELVGAARAIAQQVVNGELSLDAVDETTLARALLTHSLPDPDLLIRTSGEQRLSNFLPWQLAYTELYFTDLLWPEFDRVAFYQALRWYQNRQRRFGGLTTTSTAQGL